MAAILKFCHHIGNPTTLIDYDVYLLVEQSCQISSRSDLNWQSFRLFWRGYPNKKKNNDKMRSYVRSVSDPIITTMYALIMHKIRLVHIARFVKMQQK